MLMYHRMKKINSPVELSSLAEMGKAAHGRNLWKETTDGQRVLVFFDSETAECVSPSEFGRRQRERACRRAHSYPNGRKKVHSASNRAYSLW